MKHIIKTTLYLLSFIAVFIMSSCEKEFENEKITNSKRKITLEDFSMKKSGQEQKNSKLFIAVNRLKDKNKEQKQKSQGKTVYNSIYNFYFDDEKGKYIEVEGIKSYTFPVYRDSVEEKVENIVFKLNEDNEYDILLLKYGFTKEQLMTLTAEEIKNFDLEITTIQSKFQQDCGVNVVMCDNDGYGGYAVEPHVAGPGCHHAGNGVHLFVQWNPGICADGAGASEGYVGGGSSNGGGGGGNPSPYTTVPVLPCLGCSEPVDVDPCKSLSDLLSPSVGNARDKIIEVQNAGEGFNGEKGATFTYSNGVYGQSPVMSSMNSNANAYVLNILPNPPNPAIYAAVHTHQDNDSQTPMFSFNDLMILYKMYITASHDNQPNVTFILTLPNSSTFAIKIDDINSFKDFLNSILLDSRVEREGNEFERTKKRNEIFHNKCCSQCNPGNTSSVGTNYDDRFIVGFLTTLKNYGVSLYRATNNITGWEKLIAPANPSSTDYSTAPCNN